MKGCKTGRGGSEGKQKQELRGKFQQQSWNIFLLLLISITALNGCAGLVSVPSSVSNGTFQLSPANLSFGKVSLGKKMSKSVTLHNESSAAVTIQQATLSNPQFSLSGITTPMELKSGQQATFSVWVNPAATGAVSGTLTVVGAGSLKPLSLNLAATVITTQAQISLSASSVDFGTVSVGSKGSSTLSISNTGSSDLTVSVLTLTGAEFGISGITTPKTISAGSSATLNLSFQPTSAGPSTGSISITSNDPTNSTVTVGLSGTGSAKPAGQLTANPASFAFGNVNIGSHVAQNIILNNTGTAAAHISSVQAAGSGFAVAGVTTPATIEAGQNATLGVTFTPAAAGSATGTITITSDATETPLVIALTGSGVQPGLSVSPSSFNYGSVVDGQTKAQNFTITNTGTSALNLNQISVTGSGYSGSGLTTPATLAAGQSTTFSVQFAPAAAGVLSGTLSISSNAPNSPAVVALSGTGVAASVTVSANPISLSFGNVNAGKSSAKSVSLTNGGNTALTLSQVTVSAKDVQVSGLNLPATLGAGQSLPMNVTFSPASAESVTGSITVASAQGANAVIAVSGTGVQSALNVTPSTVSFGNVSVGTAASQTIQVSNTGTAALTISQVSVSGSGYSASGLSLPVDLNPGQASTFNIQYQPTAAGNASGTVSIVSTAPNSPNTISLSGTGIAATETISLSTNSVSFGSVTTGNSLTHGVTVTNTGNANVNISQINVSGGGFSLSGVAVPVTLTPSQSLSFNVIFNPTSAGNATGSVTVTSNASGSPATVALSGTGVAPATHSVTLDWNASTSSVSGYNVYRSTTNGSGYKKVNGGLVGSTSYTDTTVQNGTTYYYVTTAVDGSGNESSYSNQATAAIP